MTPTFTFYVIDFFVIMVACMAAAWAEDKIRLWRDRDLDINCDNCEKPLPLARTPDKQRYLCKVCMPAYIGEHFPEMDPNALSKAYRKRRKSRSKK